MMRKTEDQTKHGKRETEPDQPPAAQEREKCAAAADAAAATAPAAVPPRAEDELTALRRAVEELREKNLRLMAELQNQQKRARREQLEALRFAEFEFARELLVVLDDLERTQAAAKTASDAQAVADGVRILYEHFLKVLQARHVKPIVAVGRPFNPAFHEALLQQPSDEHPAGTVLQELVRGYAMHERVLRPSRVIVASGPAATDEKNAKKPPECDQAEDHQADDRKLEDKKEQ